MSSKLKKAIGVMKDHTSISLAKLSGNTSSNLEVAVLKATTHDDGPADDKYVSAVLGYVSSNKIYAAACARAIGKRIGRTHNWAVILKSLMLVLRIFRDGDPYFPCEVLHIMKRGARILNPSVWDSSVSSPLDFMMFVRTVALYLQERLECFLTGRLQRRYIDENVSIPGGDRRKHWSAAWKANEPIWDIKPAMLIDKLTYWQRLLDRAMDTRPMGVAKTSALVQLSFYAIVRESFDLHQDISSGLGLFLDSFYHLQYENCVSAIQLCRKAVKQFQDLDGFYTFCKEIGVGRISEYPTVQMISEELIENLQEFLNNQSPNANVKKRSARRIAMLKNNSSVNRSAADGLVSMSLEELMKATDAGEIVASAAQSFSIDLEAYSPSPQRDDAWVTDTCSTRSLPVLQSIRDMVLLNDWTEKDERNSHRRRHHHQQRQKPPQWPRASQQKQQQQQHQMQKGALASSDSTNWEIALAETLESPLSDNFTNTFNAFPNQPRCPPHKNPPAAASPPDNHYNPFLQDSVELTSPPTFSAQDWNQMQLAMQNEKGNNPFAVDYSVEEKWNDSAMIMNQQKLQVEQRLWMQNQTKIIGKSFT